MFLQMATLYFLIAESYSLVHMCYIIFIHLPVDGHVGCSHILGVVNNAAINIGVQISFQISVFMFFE